MCVCVCATKLSPVLCVDHGWDSAPLNMVAVCVCVCVFVCVNERVTDLCVCVCVCVRRALSVQFGEALS